MSFFSYLLRCADGSYYGGHTDNLERRLGQHQASECGGYTATRLPVTFAWSQEFATREEALIAGDWKRVQQLAWGTKNPLPEHLK